MTARRNWINRNRKVTALVALLFVVVILAVVVAVALRNTSFSPPTSDDMTTNNCLVTLAYYYPWYIKDDWSRHGFVGTPELGLYGTDDPKIAEQHIEWAEGAIDVLVVSWWGPDTLVSQHMETGLLQASNLNKTRFCIHYESLGRLDEADGVKDSVIDFSVPAVMEKFIADFRLLRDVYFGHDRYYRLNDGRPVVPIYVTRTFRNFNRRHFRQLEEAIGMELFLIADEVFFSAEDDPLTAQNGIDLVTKKPIFDAYTAYNMFENAKVIPGESAWSYMKREALPIFKQWSSFTHFFPHVMPSYHDFRGHEPLTGDVDGFLTQLETMWQLPKWNDDDVPKMIFVTSFNEFFEGTTIEPADEYGTAYLDALRYFRQNVATCA